MLRSGERNREPLCLTRQSKSTQLTERLREEDGRGGLPELPLPDGPREIEIGWAFQGFGGLLFTHTTDHALVALT